jgi:hypothetical protein
MEILKIIFYIIVAACYFLLIKWAWNNYKKSKQ